MKMGPKQVTKLNVINYFIHQLNQLNYDRRVKITLFK